VGFILYFRCPLRFPVIAFRGRRRSRQKFALAWLIMVPVTTVRMKHITADQVSHCASCNHVGGKVFSANNPGGSCG
jgi:hypothetical protein